MPEIRNEIYDETGLVRVEYIDIPYPTPEQLLAEKEQQLLDLHNEIQRLKNDSGDTPQQ